ncbi:MAG: glycerate kinase, partial [Planctomycetota bacterium]
LGVPIDVRGEPTDRPVTGADLHRVTAIGAPAGRFDGLEVICLCDVDNPLHGQDGAAHVFAPQKGATPQQVLQLDRGLKQVATLSEFDAMRPSMGAAGGLAFGLQHAVATRVAPGAAFIADELGLDRALAGADLCLTGEGQFDETSLRGKVVSEVARRAKRAGVPCIVLAGAAKPFLDATDAGVTASLSILHGPMSRDDAMEHAFDLLGAATEQVMRTFVAGRGKS